MRTAIYTRFSPGDDRKKTGTTLNQVQMCREHAQHNRWSVSEDHIYADELISRGSDNRPAFQNMISDIKEGNFPDILITKDTSRLARNELQAGIHKEWIRGQWHTASVHALRLW